MLNEWYSRAFETDPYFDGPFYVGFNIHGYELGQQPKENQAIPEGENVISYWGVENILDTYQQLLKMGATEHKKSENEEAK